MTEFSNRVERLNQAKAADQLQNQQQQNSEFQPDDAPQLEAPKPQWKRKLKPWELPPDPAELAELQETAERMRRQRLGRNYEGNS